MSQWPMVKLGDVVSLRGESIVDFSSVTDSPFIGLEHMAEGGGVAASSSVKDFEPKSAKSLYRKGDLLFGRLRPNLRKVALADTDGICSTDITVLTPKQDIDHRFLYFALLSHHFYCQVKNNVNGINLPRINAKRLLELMVPLPPLEEQQRITNLIENTNSQYLNTKKQHNLLKESILSFLVPRLRANSKEVPLRNIITGITSGLSPKCESGSAQDNEYGVLKLSAVTSGQFIPTENKLYTGPVSNIKKYLVKEGDILMTRKNTPELVGAVALASESSSHLAIPDLIYKIQIDESCISSQVFQKIMMLPIMRNRIKSISGGSNTSMSNISQKRLLEVKFPLPAPELHRDMISILMQSHKLEQELGSKLQKLEELHQSLATRAFAGQL